MCPEQLTVVFNHRTLNAGSVVKALSGVLAKHGVSDRAFQLSGEHIDLPDVMPRLLEANQRTFQLSGNGFEFALASVRNFKLDFIEIKSTLGPSIPWDEWAACFFSVHGFVMAWLANCDYEYWQNAQDFLEYEAAGKPYSDLPTKSNGLPFPLERTILDTSANPGRRILRAGYIEAVGAVMWLGERFWAVTGADRKQAESMPLMHASVLTNGVMRLQAAEGCFATGDGPSGALQSELRSLLFPVGDSAGGTDS